MADELEVLETELAGYVDLRRRIGKGDYRFADALIGHRRQAIENLLSDEDLGIWPDRIRLLDRLAERKGVVLADERPLRFVLDEIAERERKRRAEDIERRKEAAS